MNGLKLAALYGVIPQGYGLCGPQEKSDLDALLGYISEKDVAENEIREILKQFEAAYPYYCLISNSNGIEDPFNLKAVSAYWIGNELLDNVPVEALRDMISRRFARPGLLSKKTAKQKTKEVPSNSIAHHSFHVLVLGSITQRVVLKGNLLDICRIGWGRVIDPHLPNNQIMVEYEPLLTKEKYLLGSPVRRRIGWKEKLIPQIREGDWVSLHWNHAIQILSQKDVENLRKYTQKTLDSINTALSQKSR